MNQIPVSLKKCRVTSEWMLGSSLRLRAAFPEGHHLRMTHVNRRALVVLRGEESRRNQIWRMTEHRIFREPVGRNLLEGRQELISVLSLNRQKTLNEPTEFTGFHRGTKTNEYKLTYFLD